MLACLTSADPEPAHLLKQQSLKRAITVALYKLTKSIFNNVLLKGISKDYRQGFVILCHENIKNIKNTLWLSLLKGGHIQGREKAQNYINKGSAPGL